MDVWDEALKQKYLWNSKVKEVYGKAGPLVVVSDIKMPPCHACEYFSPRIKTDPRGNIDGIVICIAKELFRDFSCYKEKGVEKI